MASKLKVEELRDELAQRGLSTIGVKSTLVRRLESAIRKESRQSEAVNDGSMARRKRERSSEDGDLVAGPEKIVAVEKFREMSVKKLREEANLRGISATGTKKELLERLCSDLEKKTDENVEDEVDGPEKIMAVEKFREMSLKKLREEANLRGISATGTKKELLERLCSDSEKKTDETVEEVVDEKKERRVVATKKGAAVLDEWLPDHIKAHYHVLQQGDDIYDAMLNQTNVGANNNKFYVIQLLESDDGSAFMVYNRWGRVGIKGQDKLHGPFTARDGAMQEFEIKFYAKTKNHWSDRKSFVTHPKCYAWLEMDYNEKEPESNVKKMPESSIAIQPRETQLETRVAKFISLVCNVSMMKQQMMEIGYNADKLPLGKLSKTTILKGYDVLKRIADVIDRSDRKTLEQLSGEFYTVIPHDFGFKKMREFVIDTPQKLKRKLEMVEALGEIEVATKLLKEDMEMLGDPLYAQYKRLQCDLTPLETESKEFNMIAKYMRNTHAKTHSNYSVDIAQIFRVSKEGEAERYRKFSSTKNRMLLWHGSRLSNWTGILSQGLRIAPPEAPVTGYMFGKGVYFADMFSKSANYCYTSRAATTGVLLLCEVALGDMAELQAAKYDADKLPEGKLSTKGVGSTAPDLSECEALEDDIVVPLGKPKEQPVTKGALLYNEYIVYNVDQIRMRYVVQVNFKYKR